MLAFRAHGSIAEIPEAQWNALDRAGSPLCEWALLHILEASGCASAEKGWRPMHLALWRGERLVAAAPAYLKAHSFGEFFYNDFSWPSAAAHFGVRYFPKLAITVPFNPCAGPRVLMLPDEDRRAATAALLGGAKHLARENGWSSVHVLFPRAEDLDDLQAAGLTPGAGMQFHWHNRGYHTFEDFLARLSSKKRTQLRREWSARARDGLEFRTLTGSELTPEVMRLTARCYTANIDKYPDWGIHHLNERYFELAGERFAHHAEVILATAGDTPLGAAFNVRGERRLYGRHWGALEPRPFLHFQVCYYAAIERAIALGLDAFEPGAGGEHKWARGFDPTAVHSAHWFADARFAQAMERYLPREVAAVDRQIALARAQSPMRRP